MSQYGHQPPRWKVTTAGPRLQQFAQRHHPAFGVGQSEFRRQIAEPDRTFERNGSVQSLDLGVVESGPTGRCGARKFGFEGIELLLQFHQTDTFRPRSRGPDGTSGER